jgi:L-2-hydroxyglutarate oxidase LhgO
MESTECVVIGAGVIGLAVARAAALAGLEVILLERENDIGAGTSSRNSEVIHAGIYYQTDSLKARLCVRGKRALYAYCAERGVAHNRIGKIIVAAHEADFAKLDALENQAAANGIDDLQRLSQADIAVLEPAVSGMAGLLSPSTGIIDSHGLMLAYQGEAEDRGTVIAFESPLLAARATGDGFVLKVGGAAPMELGCKYLINAAGLGAQSVAAAIDGLDAAHVPTRYLLKGSYFTMTGGNPFSRLIYPIPSTASLGVHLTLDLAGQAKFGPDQEWIDVIDYAVDPDRARSFYDAVRLYYPGLADGALTPAYSGIRPKVQAPGTPRADFVIDGADVHGVPGLVNMFGMESPGLTSSLSIGEYVVELLER